VALDCVERLGIASCAGEDEGALERSKQHGRLLGRFRARVSELDVDPGDCGLITGEQFADVDAEVGVGGDGVDDGRSQWTAQGEIVLDEQIPPRCHDFADGLGEGLRFAERPLELDEDLGESEIDRFGHELCLAAREVQGGAAYGATKASLEAMTRAWAAEYSASGVRVNAIAPGPVYTPSPSGPEFITALGETTPMHRASQPEEIAEVVAFLASPPASYVTGTTVAADGAAERFSPDSLELEQERANLRGA
jgi:NAD(P)-dependent dehydrogenase (short-subunit alcohol dehydrogenase family)